MYMHEQQYMHDNIVKSKFAFIATSGNITVIIVRPNVSPK